MGSVQLSTVIGAGDEGRGSNVAQYGFSCALAASKIGVWRNTLTNEETFDEGSPVDSVDAEPAGGAAGEPVAGGAEPGGTTAGRPAEGAAGGPEGRLEVEFELAEVPLVAELVGTMYIWVRSVSEALSTKGEPATVEPLLGVATTRDAIRVAPDSES